MSGKTRVLTVNTSRLLRFICHQRVITCHKHRCLSASRLRRVTRSHFVISHCDERPALDSGLWLLTVGKYAEIRAGK
ncbi:hypothetical protein J6590_031994 [Homalodisca vitripennis]|nr:hypothetical protein J6590_031994 [Homalodisca vitripennis]